jgi:hypothetical protein
MSMVHWWNDIDEEELKRSKKNMCQCHFVHLFRSKLLEIVKCGIYMESNHIVDQNRVLLLVLSTIF